MSKFDPEHWQQVKAVFAGALERVGAEIKTLPLVPGKSTSQLIERMRR